MIDRWEKFKNSDSILNEAKLSRIWKHIESDGNFGVISAFRRYYSNDENIKRHNKLKSYIRNILKLGYIEIEGSFNEEGEWVTEKSLFVPDIQREDIIELGIKMEQYSIIFKDELEFVEIGTNDVSGIGKILTDFIKSGWDKNIQIDSDLTNSFFSRLIKGSHSDRKFLFNIKESNLYEVIERNFNSYYKRNYKRELIRLI